MRSTPSLYAPRQSGLHRLHPLTKGVLSLTALAAAATLPDLPAVLAVYLVVLTPLAAWGGVLLPFLRASSRALLPFLVSLLIIQGLFAPGRLVLIEVGPLAVTAEGIGTGLLYAARLWVGLGSAVLMLLTTRLDHLMQALTERGLSGQIAYIVVAALQIVPHFQVRALTILEAQRSRGLDAEAGLGRRLLSLPALVTPLLLSSLLETDKRAIALEARGFRRPGPRSAWAALPDTAGQRRLRWLCLLAALSLIVARVAAAFP